MKLLSVLTLLCSLSTSLAGAAHPSATASKETKAAKTTAAQTQGTGTNPCADAAKCSAEFVSNLAISGDAYKTFLPASLPSGTVSTSAHTTSHKSSSSKTHESSPSKSHKSSPSKTHESKPSKTHESKPSKTHESKPSKTHESDPTHKKGHHGRDAEDDPEISVTNSDTELAAADSSGLVRRHGRDWNAVKRTPDWSGTSVPEGHVDFAGPNQGIFTQNMNTCTGVLAVNNRGTVLAHFVCAERSDLHHSYGSVGDQYAKFEAMVSQKLGRTGLNLWVSMPAETDQGFAEAQPILSNLRRDFPSTSGNHLSTTNRAAGVKGTIVDHANPPYYTFGQTWAGLAWQPTADASEDWVKYSQTVYEYRVERDSPRALPGYPKVMALQPRHAGFTLVY